jgi:hypothetical protein
MEPAIAVSATLFMRSRFTLHNYRHRAGLALLVAALCLIPFQPARIAGFLICAGALPGIAIAARSRFSRSAAAGLGTSISPVLFGCGVLVAMALGAHANAAAWIAVVASLVLFVVAWRGAANSANASMLDRRSLAGLVLLFAVAAVMSFALPLSDLWWRSRDDSWFHAAVTGKLLRDGLPVTDPYFAGLRLQYMYFYHSILAACSSLTGVDAFHAMILVNVVALVSCATAFHALAGMFARRPGPRLLGTALWLFGMNGWFYLFHVTRLLRAFTGETQGTAVLHGFFPWSPNGHATATSLISVEGNQFMFLDKFMLGTAFSLTFSIAASILFLLLSARRGVWSARHDFALFFCSAGAMLLHPLTGITLAAVTAAVLALLLLVRSQTSRGGPSYSRLVGWLAAGMAATLPYVGSVMPRGGSGEALAGFRFQPAVALGTLADILPALVFAAWFFRRAGEDTDTAARFGARPFTELTLSGSGLVALWCLLMLALALAVDLPVNNETKFAYFVWLPLCALATGCFERVWTSRRPRRVAWAAVATASLPLHMLYFHHAFRDSSRLVITDQERAVYQWIRRSTPRDAVFIEEDDVTRVPVLADRDLYWGTDTYARQFGYPPAEMDARRALRDRIFSSDGPGADDVLQLRVLGRRVFVIYRTNDDSITAPEHFERSPRLRGKFATTEVAVWEVIMD